MASIISMREWVDQQTWVATTQRVCSTTNLKMVLAVGWGIDKEMQLGQTFVGGCLTI
jgi:hypothetical protein